jgi:predicted alpha/beta-fold hydrolase
MADHDAAENEAREMPGSSPWRVLGDAFGGRSRWADVGGPLHYLDFGGPAEASVIVAVHGLGGSSANWAAVAAPTLTARYRLVAPDLGGFGLTRAAGRDVSVPGNRVLLHRFLQAVPSVGRGPVILMGNSMGGMIPCWKRARCHRGCPLSSSLTRRCRSLLLARSRL